MASLSEGHKVVRAAGVVSLATLGSRLTGFLRDIMIAYLFGAGPAADAFFVAYRLPNLLRRLFAEGALTAAFVPVFTDELANKGKEEAFRLARATFSLLALTLLLVCVVGIVLAPWLVRLVAPGFASQEATFALTVTLTRWCLPYIFFISLAALAAGVLNSLNHFFAPAASTILLNLAMILCAALLASRVEPAVWSLALGVIVGGLAQVALQMPFLRRHGLSLRPLWQPRMPGVGRIIKLMGPAAFGAAVYQITVLINTVLASWLPAGSVSYLYYADRIVEFPLGVFGIALATAILPSLSRQSATGEHRTLVETMGFGIRMSMFIHLPAMVGLIVLAEPLVQLLFGRGEFGPHSVRATALALVGYSLGLWAYVGSRTVSQAFFALKDTRTPVKAGAWCLLVNLGASLALMGPFAHTGLAAATALSSAANMMLLLWYLRARLGPLGGRRLLRSSLWMLLASLAMGLATAAVAYLPSWGPEDQALYKYLRPLAAVLVGVASYLGASWGLRLPEFGELKRIALGQRVV
jgi:putative peptidoglycan lipid II flippase